MKSENKNINKIFIYAMSLLTVICMLFAMSAGYFDFSKDTAYAEGWSGQTQSFYTEMENEGSTLDNPYIIDTAEKLAYLADEVNSGKSFLYKYFELTRDIDLNNKPWTPIGNLTNSFSGEFNGKSHIIKNLYIDSQSSEVEYLGLFGNVGINGSINNLMLKVGSVKTSNENALVGSLVGYANGAAVKYVKNEGVAVSGKGNVGGLFGYIVNSNLEGAYNYATIESLGDNAGGIAAKAENCNSKYLINEGKIIGTNNIGGVFGYVLSGEVLQASNRGEVRTISLAYEYNNGGGIIGKAYNISKIDQWGNRGNISMTGSNVGGLVGEWDSYSDGINAADSKCIQMYCYNDGNISGKDYVAGFIGKLMANKVIRYNQYSTGGLTITGDSSTYIDAFFNRVSVFGGDTGFGSAQGTSYCLNTLNVSFSSGFTRVGYDSKNIVQLGSAQLNTDDNIIYCNKDYKNFGNESFSAICFVWEIYGGGEGTKNNPYRIVSEDPFISRMMLGNSNFLDNGSSISQYLRNCYFIQEADLDFKNNDNIYDTITSFNRFKSYDGNNYKISNFIFGDLGFTNNLFNGVEKGSELKNVHIDSGRIIVSTEARDRISVFGNSNSGIVSHCTVDVDFEYPLFSYVYENRAAGYFIYNYGIIEECVFYGNIDLQSNYYKAFGSFVCGNSMIIRNCVSYANFSGYSEKGTMGGIFTYSAILEHYEPDNSAISEEYKMDHIEVVGNLFLGSIDFDLKDMDIDSGSGVYPIGRIIGDKDDMEFYNSNPKTKITDNYYLTDNINADTKEIIDNLLASNNFGSEYKYINGKPLSNQQFVRLQEEIKPAALSSLDSSVWEFKKNESLFYYYPKLKNTEYVDTPIMLCRVEFHSQFIDIPTILKYINYGEVLTAPDGKEREGFIIDSWYREPGLYNKYVFGGPLKQDLTLYGHWNIVKPNITIVSSVSGNVINSGDRLILTAFPSHVLDGQYGFYEYVWSRKDGSYIPNRNNQSIAIKEPSESAEYYCTVIFYYKNFNSENVSETVNVQVNKLIPNVDTPEILYKFNTSNKLSDVNLPEGWVWESPDSSLIKGYNYYTATYYPIDSDHYQSVDRQIRVYAVSNTLLMLLWILIPILICLLILLLIYLIWLFNFKTYTIEFETFGGEKIEAIKLMYNDSIVLPVPHRSGYIFKAWMADCNMEKVFDTQEMPRHNITVFALWVRSSKKLLISKAPSVLPAGESPLLALPDGEYKITYDEEGNIVKKKVNSEKKTEELKLSESDIVDTEAASDYFLNEE